MNMSRRLSILSWCSRESADHVTIRRLRQSDNVWLDIAEVPGFGVAELDAEAVLTVFSFSMSESSL